MAQCTSVPYPKLREVVLLNIRPRVRRRPAALEKLRMHTVSPVPHASLISFGEAVRLLPRAISPATLWRWHQHGRRGHKLRAWRLGGRLFTTREALFAFLRDLQTPRPSPTVPAAELVVDPFVSRELDRLRI